MSRGESRRGGTGVVYRPIFTRCTLVADQRFLRQPTLYSWVVHAAAGVMSSARHRRTWRSDGSLGSNPPTRSGQGELGTSVRQILLYFRQSDLLELPISADKNGIKIGCHAGNLDSGRLETVRCAEWSSVLLTVINIDHRCCSSTLLTHHDSSCST